MIPPKISASVGELYEHLPEGLRSLLSALFLLAVIWLALSPAYVAIADRHMNRTKKFLEILKLRLDVEKAAKDSGLNLELGPYGEELIKQSCWAMFEDLRPSSLGKHPFEKRMNCMLIMLGTAIVIMIGQFGLGHLASLLPWPIPYGWWTPLVVGACLTIFIGPAGIVLFFVAPLLERHVRDSKPLLKVASMLLLFFELVVIFKPGY